jgi:hypothetical protein
MKWNNIDIKPKEDEKVKQLADELYNQKVLDGWKNVSMERCLKIATDYYRMDKQTKTK